MKCFASDIMKRLKERFNLLYGEEKAEHCINRLAMLVGRYGIGIDIRPERELWNEKSTLLITYGDMISSHDGSPLAALNSFLSERLKDAISMVHILPFFPFSSDDGFSVIDYRAVDEAIGTWNDVVKMGKNFDLVFDLVLNHVSRHSAWFKNYITGVAPHNQYFLEVDPKTDLSAVVRPRSLPLLTSTRVRNRKSHVWTTFSDDQIDLNFANPDVLFEFLDILMLYISKGACAVRLDAIAYLWKTIGTSCIHLPETHEVVKLIRDVVDMVAPGFLVLTETNVPNEENLSYFGDGDEAHMVYQFPLPPLLLHSLLTGQTKYLTEWAASLPNLPKGQTFLNFTASHDGIGVRPLEGIVPDNEIKELADNMRARKGHISTKANPDGSESPYEMNISYLDALSGPDEKDHEPGIKRFLCSQTVPMVLKGIPAAYFNSIVGGKNDYEGVERTGRARSINRQKWDAGKLNDLLDDKTTINHKVFHEYARLLRLRAEHPAFHPDGNQEVLKLGSSIFAVRRSSPDDEETLTSISNLSALPVKVPFKGKISSYKDKKFRNLIMGNVIGKDDHITLDPYETVWLVPEQ